jgi:hypothetical protein
MMRKLRVILLSLVLVACASEQPGRSPSRGDALVLATPLDSTLAALDTLLTPEQRDTIRLCTENCVARFHFGLGMWIRNEFGLWGGSRLQEYFLSLGVTHPDNMSHVIIDAYWHHLNHVPYEIKDLIAAVPPPPQINQYRQVPNPDSLPSD